MAEVNNYLRQRIDFFLDSLRISTGPSNQHQPLREFTWTTISYQYQHHNRTRFTESQEFIPELVLSLLVRQVMVVSDVTKAGDVTISDVVRFKPVAQPQSVTNSFHFLNCPQSSLQSSLTQLTSPGWKYSFVL